MPCLFEHSEDIGLPLGALLLDANFKDCEQALLTHQRTVHAASSGSQGDKGSGNGGAASYGVCLGGARQVHDAHVPDFLALAYVQLSYLWQPRQTISSKQPETGAHSLHPSRWLTIAVQFRVQIWPRLKRIVSSETEKSLSLSAQPHVVGCKSTCLAAKAEMGTRP